MKKQNNETKPEVFNALSDEFRDVASWLAYDIGGSKIEHRSIEPIDIIMPEGFNIDFANTRAMFVTDSFEKYINLRNDWESFHNPDLKDDTNIPYMVIDTWAEGAYITQLFKDYGDKKHGYAHEKLLEYMDGQSHPEIDDSIAKFQKEFDLVNPDAIFVIGKDAMEDLEMLKDAKKLVINGEVKLIRLADYDTIDHAFENRDKVIATGESINNQ